MFAILMDTQTSTVRVPMPEQERSIASHRKRRRHESERTPRKMSVQSVSGSMPIELRNSRPSMSMSLLLIMLIAYGTYLCWRTFDVNSVADPESSCVLYRAQPLEPLQTKISRVICSKAGGLGRILHYIAPTVREACRDYMDSVNERIRAWNEGDVYLSELRENDTNMSQDTGDQISALPAPLINNLTGALLNTTNGYDNLIVKQFESLIVATFHSQARRFEYTRVLKYGRAQGKAVRMIDYGVAVEKIWHEAARVHGKQLPRPEMERYFVAAIDRLISSSQADATPDYALKEDILRRQQYLTSSKGDITPATPNPRSLLRNALSTIEAPELSVPPFLARLIGYCDCTLLPALQKHKNFLSLAALLLPFSFLAFRYFLGRRRLRGRAARDVAFTLAQLAERAYSCPESMRQHAIPVSHFKDALLYGRLGQTGQLGDHEQSVINQEKQWKIVQEAIETCPMVRTSQGEDGKVWEWIIFDAKDFTTFLSPRDKAWKTSAGTMYTDLGSGVRVQLGNTNG
ncbi:hypothetical protein BZG36_00925 [Bifiguratus adelaidae]|uniref:Man1/Src1-like C-terminal domain-containing protein n=1 Tax=Bifiguratus adelaidae TaxID=1938954 RepID=A0A261Y5F4_9FUNG|nr:hypothetical protein BZG36_00925 [Bifiguratus adelaidae]